MTKLLSRLLVLILMLFSTCPAVKAQQKKVPPTTLSVYFDFNKSTIPARYRTMLDSLAESFNKAHTSHPLLFAGYCDARGSDVYNNHLSYRRALAVKQYLKARCPHVEMNGPLRAYGKRKPVNANKTPAERQANRRVDIIINEGHLARYVQSQNHSQSANNLRASLDTAPTGSHIILHDLHFHPGLHRLLPESKPMLDTLLYLLQSHPDMVIRIEGHVCCTQNGADGEDNETRTLNLSWNRAKAVYEYLVGHGIPASRLFYLGKAGKEHIADPEITEEDKIKNRRVEIVVLKR